MSGPVFAPMLKDRLLRAASGCALAALFALGTGPGAARADDFLSPEGIIDGVMTSLGMTRGGEPQIDYRERSPLVIPPSTGNVNLPPPQSADVKDPNWPVDPEVRLERQLKASAKDDGLTSSQRIDQAGLPLLPSELEKGRTSKKSQTGAPGSSSEGFGRPYTPSELGYRGGIFDSMFGSKSDKGEAASFTGEGPRTSLIDPPAGYQTPSPNQPYGVGKEKYKPKAYDYYTDHFSDQWEH